MKKINSRQLCSVNNLMAGKGIIGLIFMSHAFQKRAANLSRDNILNFLEIPKTTCYTSDLVTIVRQSPIHQITKIIISQSILINKDPYLLFQLAPFPYLSELEVQIEKDDEFFTFELPSIQYLRIASNVTNRTITDSIDKILGSTPNLVKLSLKDLKFKEKAILYVNNLKCIHTLELIDIRLKREIELCLILDAIPVQTLKLVQLKSNPSDFQLMWEALILHGTALTELRNLVINVKDLPDLTTLLKQAEKIQQVIIYFDLELDIDFITKFNILIHNLDFHLKVLVFEIDKSKGYQDYFDKSGKNPRITNQFKKELAEFPNVEWCDNDPVYGFWQSR